MATKFITISIEIMRDPNLNQSQKFILAEIEQLTTLEKGCFATNLHFANLIGISKENVSKNINSLMEKGYIFIEIVNGSRNHTRIITLATLIRPPYQIDKTPLSNRQETKENIQSNKTNNISIDIVSCFFNENKEIQKDDKSINYLSDFVTYRKKIKKPIKTTANLKLYYNKLKELHIDGFDIDKCIEEMKTREWQMIDKEYLKNRKDLKVSNSKVISNTSNDSVLI